MTLAELISLVDKTRPNPFDTELKTLWVNEVEHRAYADVVKRALHFDRLPDYEPLNYERDSEKTLLIPDQYGDAYLAYVYSKIDFTLGESDRYNNDAEMANAAFRDYSAWYRRNHYPNAYETATPIFTIKSNA